MFFSTHYGGDILALRFRNGEPWKKVFGPVYIYLNSVSSDDEDILTLWTDAKEQVLIYVTIQFKYSTRSFLNYQSDSDFNTNRC